MKKQAQTGKVTCKCCTVTLQGLELQYEVTYVTPQPTLTEQVCTQ